MELQEFQSRSTEEEKVVWQKFIDYHQKSLLEMRGSALQQEVRRVAEIISNDFGIAWQNVQSLIPSETETRDDFVKKLKETIDSYEKELKQYDLDKIKNAGFSLFDLDRIEAMKAELPMLKEFLSYFKLPDMVIAVTGSAGKGSTSTIIADTLTMSGKVVIHNRFGSNMTPGITTLLIENSKLDGSIKADAVVIEVDERYTKKV